jgi:hypothetical protein
LIISLDADPTPNPQRSALYGPRGICCNAVELGITFWNTANSHQAGTAE